MKNLIPMTDFVLEQRLTADEVNKSSFQDLQNHINEYYDKVTFYAKFLKQSLTLGMFVPCDEDGNVLQKPKEMAKSIIDGDNGRLWAESVVKYNQAKERVLFEGFEFEELYKWGFKVSMRLDDYYECLDLIFEDTVEDLLTTSFEAGFELTKYTQKKIGL